MSNAHISKERPVNAYAELRHASQCVLEFGRSNQEGSAWQFLSSAVLTAFAFEAYLNHIGPCVITHWEKVERFPVWSKFTHIRKALNVKFAGGKGARPLSSVDELIAFRNSLAHGRSVTLLEQAEVPAPNGIESLTSYLREDPQTEWEAAIQTSAFAERAREDVEVVLRALHAAIGNEDDVLFSFGVGRYQVTTRTAP